MAAGHLAGGQQATAQGAVAWFQLTMFTLTNQHQASAAIAATTARLGGGQLLRFAQKSEQAAILGSRQIDPTVIQQAA